MSQYFDEIPDSKSDVRKHDTIIDNQEYSFYTDNGVFSKSGLDDATKYLLETYSKSRILINLKGKVLDFGCGYGPIGIYIASNSYADVDMVDINERALDLAHKNADLNNVDVNIYKSNIYSNVSGKYDLIITNPPIRVGKAMLHEILFGAKDHLNNDGELWLVISKNQGAKSLARDLESTYKVEIVDKIKSFYIICCKNR
jgi:16S rRNA (guanine1207-N2)-methyltransferase